MLKIRQAAENEFDQVRAFYHTLIDTMQTAEYSPKWEKDIYPSNEYLMTSIQQRELYLGCIDQEIIAAMVINHAYNESYQQIDWPTKALPEEVTVLHILGVRPDFGGKGLAKDMVAYLLSLAKENRQKAVRLDVLKGNLPAEKLYLKMGFTYIDTIMMYYEDTGWMDFDLYEYKIA